MKPRFTDTEKECIKCHKTFPLENFYMAIETGIYSARCKKCDCDDHRRRFNASYKSRATVLFHSAKSRSRHHHIPFAITKQDIIRQYELQQGKCYYSGRNLSHIAGTENVMSIDRIDPTLGYTPTNIVICCWRVNKMKSNIPSIDFLSLCEDVCHFSANRKL